MIKFNSSSTKVSNIKIIQTLTKKKNFLKFYATREPCRSSPTKINQAMAAAITVISPSLSASIPERPLKAPIS